MQARPDVVMFHVWKMYAFKYKYPTPISFISFVSWQLESKEKKVKKQDKHDVFKRGIANSGQKIYPYNNNVIMNDLKFPGQQFRTYLCYYQAVEPPSRVIRLYYLLDNWEIRIVKTEIISRIKNMDHIVEVPTE